MSVPGATKAPIDSKAHWITPKEQLGRLCLPLAQEVSRVSSLIPEVAGVVAQYASDEAATNWYTALDLFLFFS